ncbi:MAG: DUF177 domain-containing protein [Deltaproteobacteria bacterium]|nr:DUF177 domain-containing protein [Deltaproteobacteria bacterium]
MKINVLSIPESGQSVSFDQETPWFRNLLHSRLSKLVRPDAPASGNIDLLKTMQNVSLSGDVKIEMHTTCARCGADYDSTLDVPLVRNLAPYFPSPKDEMISEEEEIELSADDLEFSFYHHEQIDLGEVVAEEILLAMPIRFVCKESCLGLCSKCGINLNEGTCSCQEEVEGSPFAVLKGIKLKS